MLSRFLRSRKGFTVIELAIVMVISGLMMGMAFSAYRSYIQNRHALENYDKQKLLATSLSNYSGKQTRLPCPAVPGLALTDINSGRELPPAQCSALKLATTAIGTCVDFNGNPSATGVCKVDGARDTAFDPDTTIVDPVLTGTIPFATVKEGFGMSAGWSFTSGNAATLPTPPPQECLSTVDGSPQYCDADSNGVLDANVRAPTLSASFEDAVLQTVLDPWGFQMSYAVTASLTGSATFKSANGAIAVQTEDGTSLVKPTGSAHYVIVSYGDNHAGAYNALGQMPYPCLAGATETENCDGDAVFVEGLRMVGTGASALATYHDDVVWHSVVNLSKLWEFANSTDIFNLNIGNIGIGTYTPDEKLTVGSAAAPGSIKASKATQKELCGVGNDKCWDPDDLASPAGNLCDMTYPPAAGKERVVIGIVGGKVKCTTDPADPAYTAATADLSMPAPQVNQFCAAGKFALGFNPDGSIICTP